jgi:PPOX class probable F420-dependent enzyme
MSFDPAALPEAVAAFARERHLATLVTPRADGSPHAAPVGFTWDADGRLARVITFADARKARNLASAPGARVALCQVDGGRWLTFEGTAAVSRDPARVAEAVRRYAERYRPPSDRPDRVVIEVAVDRVMGRA